MAQGTFIDGAALSVVQGVINDNATDAQDRLVLLETDQLKAEVVTFTGKVNEAGGVSIGDVVYISGATGGAAQGTTGFGQAGQTAAQLALAESQANAGKSSGLGSAAGAIGSSYIDAKK
jgi:hypothetical protein